MNWTVPPMWTGRTVAVLASGPSMSRAVADAVRSAGCPAIAVNSTFAIAPWADMLYAADPDWWHSHRAEVQGFAGLKVSCRPASAGLPKDALTLLVTGPEGFDPDPACIRTGGHSGYQAVHIAAQAGARRILLCGFDLHDRNGSHWHGDHPHPLRNTGPALYEQWCTRFATLAAPLAGRGVEVVNCTPGSALKCFRCGALEDELALAAAA